MKKRAFMLVMLAVYVLLLSASARANAGYDITGMTSAYTTIYSTDVRAGYRVNIVISTTLTKYADGTNYAQSADQITWTVTNDAGALTHCKLVSADDESVEFTEAYVANLAEGAKTYKLRLVGNIAGAGDVKVTAALNGKNMSGSSSKYVTIAFNSESGSDVYTEDTDYNDSSIAYDTDTNDPRDPESREWDGLFPPFALDPSGDVGTLKPKVAWAKPEDFISGTKKTIKATVTGPVEGINVFIAAKDAARVFGIDKETAVDIPLTSANIKQYNIPFRVTVVDDSGNIATGTKADKKITTTVTLEFNGGTYSYKGLPVTLSAWNSNNEDRPVAKKVKLTVTPNVDAPVWGILTDTSETIVTTTSGNYVVETSGDYSILIGNSKSDLTVWASTYLSQSPYYDTTGKKYMLLYDQTTQMPAEVKYNASGDRTAIGSSYNVSNLSNPNFTTLDKNNWDNDASATAQIGNYWYAVVPTIYTCKILTTALDATTTITTVTSHDFDKFDKNAKKEVVAAIYPKEATDAERGGEIISQTFTVNASAPFSIAEVKKPKDNGISVDVTQPEFDYLGRNTVSGSVTIKGKLIEKEKESKNVISLTAINPSTKKKGAMKAVVEGKTAPYFDKMNTFNFDTNVLDSTYTYDSTLLNSESGTGYKETQLKLKTKKVPAPKVPSAKFKAKGSKTITYKLGLYDSDGEPDGHTAYYYLRSNTTLGAKRWNYMYGYVSSYDMWPGLGKQFNDELAEKLTAHSLSFDSQKGAVVITKKGAAVTPTLNDDGDQFKSLDIVVTAINDVGAEHVWAELAITGAKPKLKDKKVEISGAVQKGDVFTFKLMSNKTAAETISDGSANIRSYTAAAKDANVLTDWGLELVNYDSMDILVSEEISFVANAKIPAYNENNIKVIAGSVSGPNTEDGVLVYRAGSNGATLLSGDTWTRSKDITRRNYGIIQVVDQEKLAKVVATAASADTKGKALKKLAKGSKVNIILDNLGATAKTKITVCLKSDITDGGDPTDTTTSTASAAAAARVSSTPSAAKTGHTAQSDEAKTEQESPDDSDNTASVSIGTPRTTEDLSAEQKAFLAEKAFTVIAVLPEITADVDGQQEFPAELDEDSPEGEKLIWLAFPQNAQENDDDKIADFYNSDGKPIVNVPAEKSITVAPWLRAGVIYQPVIAVKNPE